MIVDSPDSQFWQAVYDSAKKKAAPNNVLIEIMGPDRETSYDKLDYMNMSIAAKADVLSCSIMEKPVWKKRSILQ